MNLVIKGTVTNGFWRVDDLDESKKAGRASPQLPFALFRDKRMAARCCLLFNTADKEGAGLKQGETASRG